MKWYERRDGEAIECGDGVCHRACGSCIGPAGPMGPRDPPGRRGRRALRGPKVFPALREFRDLPAPKAHKGLKVRRVRLAQPELRAG